MIEVSKGRGREKKKTNQKKKTTRPNMQLFQRNKTKKEKKNKIRGRM
jgi:hypothetical protein